jgi:hypothetical protein
MCDAQNIFIVFEHIPSGIALSVGLRVMKINNKIANRTTTKAAERYLNPTA